MTGRTSGTQPGSSAPERPPVRGPATTARTLLFVPGDRPDRFAKAAATAADLVIVDLEDAIPEDGKEAARRLVAYWLGSEPVGGEPPGGVLSGDQPSGDGRAAVRVNGTRSVHYQQDVDALAGLPGLLALVVPMADDPAALAALHQQLGSQVEIVALIETALGLVRALELASTPGVSRLAFGHLDFAADIDSSIEDRSMLMARSSLVVTSRAAGLPGPVDGVTTALDDPAAAAADANRARSLGFAGKLCIHPRQVDAVNAAFSPSAEEITWAHRIMAASTARGVARGVARVDGHMVDAPVVLKAQSILARSKEKS
jgi:citrate lyase subunit beta/citryl-CoA lyase